MPWGSRGGHRGFAAGVACGVDGKAGASRGVCFEPHSPERLGLAPRSSCRGSRRRSRRAVGSPVSASAVEPSATSSADGRSSLRGRRDLFVPARCDVRRMGDGRVEPRARAARRAATADALLLQTAAPRRPLLSEPPDFRYGAARPLLKHVAHHPADHDQLYSSHRLARGDRGGHHLAVSRLRGSGYWLRADRGGSANAWADGLARARPEVPRIRRSTDPLLSRRAAWHRSRKGARSRPRDALCASPPIDQLDTSRLAQPECGCGGFGFAVRPDSSTLRVAGLARDGKR